MHLRSTVARHPSRPSLVTTALVALTTVLASALVLVATPTAQAAATITVTTTADDTTTDGACSLREALGNADADAATSADCAAGSGEDTIVFALGGPATIPVTSSLFYTDVDMTTIDGDGLVSLQGTNIDRVLRGEQSAGLTLDGISMTNGGPAGSGVLASGPLVVLDSTFFEMRGFSGAAIVMSNPGGVQSLVVSGSTFAHNQADLGGGAIHAGNAPTSISNSTFYGNQAAFEEGGAVLGRDLAISFSTFVSNTSGSRGGAIYGTAELLGNVFQGNIEHSGGSCTGGTVDAGFNVSDETSCATAPTSLANTDAQLDPAGLAFNGGPTQTIALLPGSPAIDLVPLASGVCPQVDQRGFVRPAGPACDAGSYEAGAQAPDTTAPVVTVPADITTPAASPAGATVTYTASADDDRDGSLTPTCTPASGSTFPVGTTTVTCTATDAAGNTGSASFTVTVTPVVVPNQADLKITLTGPAATTNGATITVTATVLNQGPASAVNLNTVLAATGLTTTATNPTTGSGSITLNGTTITGARWTTTQLAAGDTLTYQLTGKVTAKKGKTVSIAAGTQSTTPDPQLATNLTAKTIQVN